MRNIQEKSRKKRTPLKTDTGKIKEITMRELYLRNSAKRIRNIWRRITLLI